MMPHLKKRSNEELEASRKAFEEGSYQRGLAMKNQKKFSTKEILEKLRKSPS